MQHTVSNKQLIFNPANFILNHNMNGPFLTPIPNQEKMSLVLDLDETLVHFFYVRNFLNFIFFRLLPEGLSLFVQELMNFWSSYVMYMK